MCGEQQQGKETSGGRDSVYFIPSSADGYITDLHGIYTKSKKLTTGVEAIKSQHDKGDMDIAEPILARNIHTGTVYVQRNKYKHQDIRKNTEQDIGPGRRRGR